MPVVPTPPTGDAGRDAARYAAASMPTQRSRSAPPGRTQASTGSAGGHAAASAAAPAPPAGRPETVPLALVGALVGRIAHDLNNVLTPIVGNTELALYSLPEDHPARPDIEQTHTVALEKGRLLSGRLASLARAIEDPAGGDPTEALAGFGIVLDGEAQAEVLARDRPHSSRRPLTP